MNKISRAWLKLVDSLGKDSVRVVGDKVTLISRIRGVDFFWQKIPVTSSLGLNVNVKLNQQWQDCSQLRRKIIESKGRSLKIKYSFAGIPFDQIWHLELDKDTIYWRVKLHFKHFLPVDELRFLVMLKPIYKIWFSNFYQDFFTGFAHCWRDLWLQDYPHSAVGARFPLKPRLPSILFENLTPNYELYPLVQVAPKDLHFFTVGFRRLDTGNLQKQFPRLEEVFRGRILFFSQPQALDAKIENIRQQNIGYEIRKS